MMAAGCRLQAAGNSTRLTQSGFTFMEMIIVSAMVGVVSLAIYATLNNGLKIWQRVNEQLPTEELNIFFDRFNSDLRNCFSFSTSPFVGDKETFECASLLYSPRLGVRTVGKVQYLYESHDGLLKRSQSDFSGVYNKEEPAHSHVISRVKMLKFHYLAFDETLKRYDWLDTWDKKELPLAVKMELEVEYNNQVELFNKIVRIPVSR